MVLSIGFGLSSAVLPSKRLKPSLRWRISSAEPRNLYMARNRKNESRGVVGNLIPMVSCEVHHGSFSRSVLVQIILPSLTSLLDHVISIGTRKHKYPRQTTRKIQQPYKIALPSSSTPENVQKRGYPPSRKKYSTAGQQARGLAAQESRFDLWLLNFSSSLAL